MTDVVAWTNQAVLGVLVVGGGLGLLLVAAMVRWAQRRSAPPADGKTKRKPPPLTAVFTRRDRSDRDES